MLFAGLGLARMVKNCDRGLENAAQGRFKARGHSFFTSIQADPKPANNMLIFPCSKLVSRLQMGLLYATLSLNAV